MTGGEVNVIWAGIFLDELARSGVREICVAPGSRSTPLVLAAAADGRFRTTSVVDERSAGFLALGMGKTTGFPAAVITTSGTAGGNLFPAVIEASQGEVPLLVLTADRPHHLRDSDANQAIDQIRLFGSYPRLFLEMAPPGLTDSGLRHLRVQACRAVAAARGAPPGPVHLNFPFDKPLEPGAPGPVRLQRPSDVSEIAWAGRSGGEAFVCVSPSWALVDPQEAAELKALLASSSRGLIVAGPHPHPGAVGASVRALGAATGFPIMADPLSGARFGADEKAEIIGGYDLFLRSLKLRKSLVPDLILRVGASPTSASLLHFLEEHREVPQVVVDDGHRWKDHSASASRYCQADPGGLLPLLTEGLYPDQDGVSPWLARWRGAEARTLEWLDALPEDTELEGEIIRQVVEALPPGANLFIGNSMPIRDLDAFTRPGGRDLNVFGNRGASGIDGLVSTTLGVGRVSGGITLGILGDLALFHDMNGLLTLKQEGGATGFVVVNNDGGGIFHTLPVVSYEPAFSEFFATPHGLDFQAVAGLYGISFGRVERGEGLSAALTGFLAKGEAFLLEVRTSRTRAHEERRKLIADIVADFEEDTVV